MKLKTGKEILIKYNQQDANMETFLTLEEMIDQEIGKAISISKNAEVKVNFAEEIEKQMLETQLVKIEVLNCKGDADGKYLPTEILLRLGDETKWYSQER